MSIIDGGSGFIGDGGSGIIGDGGTSCIGDGGTTFIGDGSSIGMGVVGTVHIRPILRSAGISTSGFNFG